MKLRIRGNSIRFRLTKEEVASFGTIGNVEDVIAFGVGTENELRYRLETSAQGDAVNADFGNGRINLQIPQAIASRWTATEEVGIEAVQDIGDEKQLRILVEKDFACLKPRIGEDESDSFPNPLGSEMC